MQFDDYGQVQTGNQRRFQSKIGRVRLLYVLVGLVTIAVSSQVVAQRLIIEAVGPGPLVKVIYGKIGTGRLWVFEKEYVLTPLPVQAIDLDQAESSPSPNAPLELGDRPSTITSFTLSSTEVGTCTNTTRFTVFMALLKGLKDRVAKGVLKGGDDSTECRDAIAAAMKSNAPRTAISLVSADVPGVRIELTVLTQGTDQAQTNSNSSRSTAEGTSATAARSPEAEPRRAPRVELAGNAMTVDENGFFVVEIDRSEEQDLIVDVQGFNQITLKVAPQLVSDQPTRLIGGQGYSERLAIGLKSVARLVLTAIPTLDQKTSLEGGLGGGIGYGREVPGERRGQRTVSIAGIERRNWIGDFGGRATVLYSRAPATIVPQTVTLRGLAFVDFPALEGMFTARFGLGGEFFQAKIKDSAVNLGLQERVYVPEQVVGPLVSFSAHALLWDHLVVAPTVLVSPLYVPSYGFYPSLSPSLELGFRFLKRWLVVVQTGSETHRFPNPLGDTRLQLDYGVLAVKRGLQ